ncbi:hypothetical protein KM043_016139 [Ampulex compressa]|nr:hypothetical protein KM043_016139 [Ampulex compressa]
MFRYNRKENWRAECVVVGHLIVQHGSTCSTLELVNVADETSFHERRDRGRCRALSVPESSVLLESLGGLDDFFRIAGKRLAEIKGSTMAKGREGVDEWRTFSVIERRNLADSYFESIGRPSFHH